jgi:hypothetical protein
VVCTLPLQGVYGRPAAIIYTIAKQSYILLFLVTHSSPGLKPNKIAADEVKSLNNFIYVSKNTTFAVSFRIMSNLQ